MCCIQDGGLTGQRVLAATLADAAQVAAEHELRAPAVIVIGEVAALVGSDLVGARVDDVSIR